MPHLKQICLAAVFATSVSAIREASAQNLIVNPGFEINGGDGSQIAPPWNFPGPFPNEHAQVGVNPAIAHSGSAYVELVQTINGFTVGNLSQTVTVANGGAYTFSFYYNVTGVGNNNSYSVQLNNSQIGMVNFSNTTYQQFLVNIALAPGIDTFSLVNIGGIVGTNSSFNVDDFALFSQILTLTPNLVGLAQTENQRAVANGLTNAFNQANLGTVTAPNGVAGAYVAALNNVAPDAIPGILDSLSGEGIAAAQNVAHRSVSEFTSSIFDQTTFYGGSTANSITLNDAVALPTGVLSYAPGIPTPIRVHDPLLPPQRTWRAWATGFGGAETISGNAGLGSAGQTSTIYGGTLGLDYQVLPNYLAGIAIGGSEGDFQVGARSTSGSTTGGHIAFYDLATFGSFYGASTNSFSYFGNKTTRNVAGFGGLGGETEQGNFASHEFRTRLEFGRHVEAYGATITPFIALEIAELRSNGFGETSLSGPGNFLLNVSGQSSASVPSFVGARYQGKLMLANGMVLAPILQAAYVHEFAPERSQIGALSTLPGSTFLVDGARPSRDAAQVKAGLELAIGPSSAIFANFDGEFSGQAQFYGGKGGFKYVW